MWQIDNRTPFAAGQSWVRDRDGAETWLVVVKATFEILPDGSTAVAKGQPEVTRSPVYRAEPNVSSIVYENDFVLAKRTTDIVLNATAYAPDGKEVRSLDVGMQVGPVRKLLKVFGDRVWGPKGTSLSPPLPFKSMPLIYERAFGGIDQRSKQPDIDWSWPNPVGTGFVAARDRVEGVRAPNIEYPEQLITKWDARPVPAGFGVIASHWHERAQLAGTYDQTWSDERQPLVPTDFDIRHYQTVPRDQHAPIWLHGGEPVSLVNLTASGMLHFVIPEVELALETSFMDGERRQHPPPSLHTLIIEPDFPRLSQVWHSAMECHPKVYRLEKTRITLRTPGVSPSDEDVDNLLDLV